MLSNDQIHHFRTFGSVALRGLLGPHRAAALQAEVDAAIRDAFPATYDQRVIDGISGHYLPMASALTAFSVSLVCDDPVLIDAAEHLLGEPVLPSVPEGVLYTFHASFGGTDRLAWAIEYLAAPTSDEQRDKTLRWLADGFEQDFRGFDRHRYPTWRDWLANAGHHARRAQVIERMRSAGVLDLPGAEFGW